MTVEENKMNSIRKIAADQRSELAKKTTLMKFNLVKNYSLL